MLIYVCSMHKRWLTIVAFEVQKLAFKQSVVGLKGNLVFEAN